MRYDETIRGLGREVKRLTEFVVPMKSINQPPNEPEVSHEVFNFGFRRLLIVVG